MVDKRQEVVTMSHKETSKLGKELRHREVNVVKVHDMSDKNVFLKSIIMCSGYIPNKIYR